MSAKPKMRFVATTRDKLDNISIMPGQMIFVVDEKTIYLDVSKEDRTIYTSIVILDSELDRLALISPAEGFYYVKSNSSWWTYFNRQWELVKFTNLVDSDTIEIKTNADGSLMAAIKQGSVGANELDENINMKIEKAGTAVQEVSEGTAAGAILVDGENVLVHGLKSAAYADESSFDLAGAAAAVLGNALDPSSANTIYGVKALIEEYLTWRE